MELTLLDSSYINRIEPNTEFFIEEKNSQGNGQGKSIFKCHNEILLIKTKDNVTKIWCLANKKCAEAAFIIFESDSTLTLNIVEMKSKLTNSEFEKVISQFEGMYLSSIAVMAILKLGYPHQVKTFIAYKEESLSQLYNEDRPYSLNKTLIGRKDDILDMWKNEKIKLPHNVSASLVKGKRTENNGSHDYDFGFI